MFDVRKVNRDDELEGDDGDHGDDDDGDYGDDTFHHLSSLPVLIVLIGPSSWETILADLSLITMMIIMALMRR